MPDTATENPAELAIDIAKTLNPRDSNKLLIAIAQNLYNQRTPDSPKQAPKECQHLNFLCQEGRGSQITLRGKNGQADYRFNKDGQ